MTKEEILQTHCEEYGTFLHLPPDGISGVIDGGTEPVLEAMETYANQQSESKDKEIEELREDACGFAEWTQSNYWEQNIDNGGKWYKWCLRKESDLELTTKELFNLYKETLNPLPTDKQQ